MNLPFSELLDQLILVGMMSVIQENFQIPVLKTVIAVMGSVRLPNWRHAVMIVEVAATTSVRTGNHTGGAQLTAI